MAPSLGVDPKTSTPIVEALEHQHGYGGLTRPVDSNYLGPNAEAAYTWPLLLGHIIFKTIHHLLPTRIAVQGMWLSFRPAGKAWAAWRQPTGKLAPDSYMLTADKDPDDPGNAINQFHANTYRLWAYLVRIS